MQTHFETAGRAQRVCGYVYLLFQKQQKTFKKRQRAVETHFGVCRSTACRTSSAGGLCPSVDCRPSPGLGLPGPLCSRCPVQTGHHLLFSFRTLNVYKQVLFSVLIFFPLWEKPSWLGVQASVWMPGLKAGLLGTCCALSSGWFLFRVEHTQRRFPEQGGRL